MHINVALYRPCNDSACGCDIAYDNGAGPNLYSAFADNLTVDLRALRINLGCLGITDDMPGNIQLPQCVNIAIYGTELFPLSPLFLLFPLFPLLLYFLVPEYSPP